VDLRGDVRRGPRIQVDSAGRLHPLPSGTDSAPPDSTEDGTAASDSAKDNAAMSDSMKDSAAVLDSARREATNDCQNRDSAPSSGSAGSR
jgi:hypothetical protein